MEKCHCGRPLHYRSKTTEAVVREVIEELGPFVIVVTEASAWYVPRHFIALHGLKGCEVEKLGFRKVDET